MKQRLTNRWVCAAAGMACLLLVACHVDTPASRPGVSGDTPVHSAAIVMEPDFAGEPDVSELDTTTVLSIRPVVVESTASADEGGDECRDWALTSGEAEALFALSQTVDARTWSEDYGDAPCTISGTVSSGGVEWQFSINGAAKARWTRGTQVRYLGCGERECEAFGA